MYLMESYNRFGMNSYESQTASISLQELGECPHEDGAKFLVQLRRVWRSRCRRRKSVIGASEFRLENQRECILSL